MAEQPIPESLFDFLAESDRVFGPVVPSLEIRFAVLEKRVREWNDRNGANLDPENAVAQYLDDPRTLERERANEAG